MPVPHRFPFRSPHSNFPLSSPVCPWPLPCPLPFCLLPSHLHYHSRLTQGEENRNSGQDSLGVLAAPREERLAEGGGEPAVVCIPWMRTELRNPRKDLPSFLWHPDGFTKELNLTLRLCNPGCPVNTCTGFWELKQQNH